MRAGPDLLLPPLPKRVATDPRAAALAEHLRRSAQPLWREAALAVPQVPWSAPLVRALRRARSAGRLVRGLEAAARALDAEARGLRIAERARGAARRPRVSRLLVLADDGAERFYRHVETLVRRHADRVLAVRAEVDAEGLGALFGPGRSARLVLVERKESVAEILLAIAEGAEG